MAAQLPLNVFVQIFLFSTLLTPVREAMELIAFAMRCSLGPQRNYSFWSEPSSAAVLFVGNEGTVKLSRLDLHLPPVRLDAGSIGPPVLNLTILL